MTHARPEVTVYPSDTSRRTFMRSGLAGAGAASLVLGSADAAQAHGTLISRNELNGDYTHYEPTGARSSFWYNSTFYSRMETWENFFYVNTPLTWLRPLRIDSYGVHVDKGSASHDYGRGFDLAQIYVTSGGVLTSTFNGRYDLWRDDSSITGIRRWYWGTAASIHYHFKHVLTYLYNTDHWNHIHIDNLVSGSGNSTFATSSTAQVQYVQAALRYIWGYSVTIDGIWGPQTSGYASQAIARAGGSGSLTASQSNWLLFNHASTRYGTGRQAY